VFKFAQQKQKTNEDFKKNFTLSFTRILYAYNECTNQFQEKVTDSSGFPCWNNYFSKGTKSATVT
jgi:hypothetical protein